MPITFITEKLRRNYRQVPLPSDEGEGVGSVGRAARQHVRRLLITKICFASPLRLYRLAVVIRAATLTRLRPPPPPTTVERLLVPRLTDLTWVNSP